MNTFNWLLLGHLIGDWLLQNDWMASQKQQKLFSTAGFVHFTIYTIIVSGIVWLFCSENQGLVHYLRVSGIVFGSHWLIDGTPLVERWMRFYGQDPDRDFVRIIIDQTLHLMVLGVVSMVCFIG